MQSGVWWGGVWCGWVGGGKGTLQTLYPPNAWYSGDTEHDFSVLESQDQAITSLFLFPCFKLVLHFFLPFHSKNCRLTLFIRWESWIVSIWKGNLGLGKNPLPLAFFFCWIWLASSKLRIRAWVRAWAPKRLSNNILNILRSGEWERERKVRMSRSPVSQLRPTPSFVDRSFRVCCTE